MFWCPIFYKQRKHRLENITWMVQFHYYDISCNGFHCSTLKKCCYSFPFKSQGASFWEMIFRSSDFSNRKLRLFEKKYFNRRISQTQMGSLLRNAGLTAPILKLTTFSLWENLGSLLQFSNSLPSDFEKTWARCSVSQTHHLQTLRKPERTILFLKSGRNCDMKRGMVFL